MDRTPLTIFLAEDDDGHATLIRRNLERARLNAEIFRFRDGQQTLEHLRREVGKEGPRHPLLLLLDIRMPGMEGTEVLSIIKSDPKMRSVPVYMLTTTDNPVEVDRCFKLGCNAYLTKPISYEDFVGAMERLCAFLEVTQLPTTPPEPKHVTA